MLVTRPAFPAPVLCIDDFLSDDDALRMWDECQSLRNHYTQAAVFDGPHATKIDLSYRKNGAVFVNHAAQRENRHSDVLNIMRSTIWSPPYKALWHEGYLLFDVINYSTWQEAVISRYADGDFYKSHQDIRRDHLTYRLITIVYYLHQKPLRFTGGSLRLWSKGKTLQIEPECNRAVVFPSFLHHEVERVRTSGTAWEDARFSLNYWVGFR